MSGGRELAEEIESARKRLEEETKRKEKEADERLDELLTKRKMEFCPMCGSRIRSRSDWGGKCLHEDCESLVCTGCWADEAKRYCTKHAKDYAGKEEASRDDIRNMTLNYMDFLKERMKRAGPDWTPAGFIRKTGAKVTKKRYGDFELTVYEKHTFSKKPRIRILVRPLTEDFEKETNDAIEGIESDVYTIIAFAGASPVSRKAARFAGEFSNRKVSLFVMDMESGELHFNGKEKVTGKYSCWFDPAKALKLFAELLKDASESVSGRRIVYAKNFGEEMGMGKEDALRILRQSGLLEEVKGADSFIIRE